MRDRTVNRPALAATSILVTRPKDQAEHLCRLIREHGGTAINWPTIRIAAREPDTDIARSLASATGEDIAIFVSRNAVKYGARLVHRQTPPTIAAIGPSTTAELAAAGLHIDIAPRGHDSESLLEQLESREIEGRRVFIIRGTGGRETLRKGLEERGASVDYAEVYERQCPHATDEEASGILDRWMSCEHRLFTATSVAILENLATMLGPDRMKVLGDAAMVTASHRVVQRADCFGHCGARLLAPGPDDSSLLDAMILWRNGIEATEAPQGPSS